MLRSGARRSIELARGSRPAVERLHRQARTRLFESRVKTRAIWVGAQVHLRIDPTAWVGAVEIDVLPYSESTLVVDAGARIADGVRLSFRGGSMHVGRDTDVRRFGTYHVGGVLDLGAGCVLSTGVSVHCAQHVGIGDLTIVGEYTTVTDSAHRRTGPGVPIHHSVSTGSTAIGMNVWVGAHAVIGRGVTVGDQCFIGAGAVVTRDVPAGWLAGGIPATPIRALDVVSD